MSTRTLPLKPVPRYGNTASVAPDETAPPHSPPKEAHSIALPDASDARNQHAQPVGERTVSYNFPRQSSSAAATGAGPSAEPNLSRPLVSLTLSLIDVMKKANRMYFKMKRLKGDDQKFNEGYDDKEGKFIVQIGEEIADRYTVIKILGSGSFGTVLHCYDGYRNQEVAVKVIRAGTNFRQLAKQEADIVLRLNRRSDASEHFVVRLHKVLDFKGHLILVFELLSFNLYQLIKCTKFKGVSLELTRKFAWQLLLALHSLESCEPKIIHCDLKPENILLKNQNRSGIKVIDFGSSCYETKRMFKYIQSRFYRAPEVILGLPYTTAIDRWSLGCILAELHTGAVLFGMRDEKKMIGKMTAVLGPLPKAMIEAAPKRATFFGDEVVVDEEGNCSYELKQPHPTACETLPEMFLPMCEWVQRESKTAGYDPKSHEDFLEVVRSLLIYSPGERISCLDCMGLDFFKPIRDTDTDVNHYYRQILKKQDEQRLSSAAEASSKPAPPPPPPSQPQPPEPAPVASVPQEE